MIQKRKDYFRIIIQELIFIRIEYWGGSASRQKYPESRTVPSIVLGISPE